MSTFQANGQLNVGKIIAGTRISATDEPYLDLRSHLDDIYKEVYNSERAPLSIYEISQREKMQDLTLEVENLRDREEEQEKEIQILKNELKQINEEKISLEFMADLLEDIVKSDPKTEAIWLNKLIYMLKQLEERNTY